MLRLIFRETDIGAAANIGGPVNVKHETFDVDLPHVESWLRKYEGNQWTTRELVGVAIVSAAEPQANG